MSTFTEWNGPGGGRGPSTKDVLALVDAYGNLSTLLTKHTAETATDDVHGFKTALDNAIAETENALNAAIAVKANSSAVEELSEKAAETASALTVEASRAQSAETALQAALDSEEARAEKAESALNNAIEALESALEETKDAFSQALSKISFDDKETTTITGVVAATEYFIGMVKVRYLVDFIEWKTINAQFAGTGTNDGAPPCAGWEQPPCPLR